MRGACCSATYRARAGSVLLATEETKSKRVIRSWDWSPLRATSQDGQVGSNFTGAKGKTLKSALFGSASINYLVKYAAMRRDHPKS